MYLDEKNQWGPIDPAGNGRRLGDRDEKVLLWVIGIFLASLVIAPIGGASVIEAMLALIGA
ncbi:hypothetical protein [Jiella avicenniae]|uniref:Uncharacterized protein n=1 Tax=Jiella avicenniae TaxID=2907202 RepID=A0A9X1P1J6_9HYPH|nr:hypothetical protein [Jiella avicenniae]MCE7029707.1 hypothetical protein [Jiella avicenniae]